MKKILLLLAVLLAISVQAQQTKHVFLIGNSVTDGINYDGFKNMALSQRNTHIWGRHMIPGAPLELLWDDRNAQSGFLVAPFGAPGNAFPNYDWDAVTLQPFDRGIDGNNGDKQMMLNYAGLLKDKNPDVQLYIYSRYPRKPEGVTEYNADLWASLWNGTYNGHYQTNETRKFFEDLYTAFNATDKGGLNKDALIIPVGDVMYAFNQKAKEGLVPGIASAWDLYADGIHVNSIGSYIIMGTFYSTIYKEDIRGTKVPSNYGEINPDLLEVIQQTIFDIVFHHAYSGTSEADLIPATGITINKSELNMKVFNTEQLTATVQPENASKKGVIWSSSNTGVATVDDNGKVTSLSEGTTTITATSFDGGYTAQCEVSVSGTPTGSSVEGVLAGWDFNDKTGDKRKGYNYIYAVDSLQGIIYTNAYVGEGMNPDENWNSGLTGTSQTTMDLTASLADGEYIGFKIKAEPGKLLSINKIQFAPVSQGGIRTFVLFSSVKGFSEGNEIGSCQKDYQGELFNFDLTGHNNVEEIEFRVYIYGKDNMYESVGIGGIGGTSFIATGSIFTVDNEAPSKPGNLQALEVKDNYINFGWDESTDDYFVKGYNFYVNGEKKNNELIEGTSFLLEGLTSGDQCNVEVEAIDFLNMPSEKASLSIHANRAPTAVIKASATEGKLPLIVTFTCEDSSDPDESEGDYILGFDWDMGDGSPIINANTATHTFDKRGEYEVSLVVMDSRGMRSTPVTTTITVTADKYPVNIIGGATIPEANEAYESDSVYIIANDSPEGSLFKEWICDDPDVVFDDATSATTAFRMPARAVTITANYQKINYTVTVTGGTADKETATIGETVTLTPDIPEGLRLIEWIVIEGDITIENNSFVMPASNVVIEARYNVSINESETSSLSIYPNPSDNYIYIKGFSTDHSNYSIFDSTGSCILSGFNYNGEAINISRLSAGTYFIRMGNQSLPFLKK
ncbi:MAG: Ig-like domain-containing protein [Bacteroidales bacterium]|nr:Ig-like domain-containing protein [Bacteroidales bacterium]